MTNLCTFDNDLKKRDNVHVLEWEVFSCEDWNGDFVSLVENGEEHYIFVKWL